jgi:cyclopropane-fatty-acyl-phospholipid synthase
VGHLITFELEDYRVFADRCRRKGVAYDRIVSCEMIEAVGHAHLGSFFAAVDGLLTADGIFAMQVRQYRFRFGYRWL